MDIHRALGVRIGGVTVDAGHQFDRARQLEIEETQRALGVQAVDQMLDVGGRVLRMHQPGNGIFELAPIEDDRRVHREQVILARVVDVQMRVADEAHVAHPHAVARELVLDHVLMKLQPAHAERFHDLVGAIAGIDHDWIRTTQDQEAERQDPAGPAAVAPQNKEARLQFDVAIVQDLDFQRHLSLPNLSLFVGCLNRASL